MAIRLLIACSCLCLSLLLVRHHVSAKDVLPIEPDVNTRIDELYDQEVTVVASGCAVSELFPESYRHGGYRKKYGRAESRLSAMLGEAVQVPASRDTTGASASIASTEIPT